MRTLRPLLPLGMLLAATAAHAEGPATATAPVSLAPRPAAVSTHTSAAGQELLMRFGGAAHAPAPPAATPAAAYSGPPAAAGTGALSLHQGAGVLLHLPEPAANVFVADPKVAEVHPAGPTTLFVFGVGAGRTTIAALAAGGRLIGTYGVSVMPSDFGSSNAAQQIAQMVPGAHIMVKAQPKGLLLTGWVESPDQAARAVSIAQGFLAAGQTLQNQIVVRTSTQVTLQVRIVQMARSIGNNLGINWQALGSLGSIGTIGIGASGAGLAASALTNGLIPARLLSNAGQYSLKGVNINAALNMLATDNLVRMLAEPNLTVMSGQPASFLVGGEIPVPVPGQSGQVSIEYKKFGVSLSFLPTVLNDGRINIHVAPEVSQPTNGSTVSITAANQVFQVPSFSVSRAETSVQLGSGQSFAIGGLLQDTINDDGSGVPNLQNVPILGALFHNDNFTRQQTELVIIVTPYIVRPVNSIHQLQTPDENYAAPTDLQRLLLMRQVGTPRHWERVPVPGHAGFMVQ
ncbi:MAG: type II and III secretion system protein family protein [Rhodospirillales bacterium]|nr:type II and III secretion system protein family protein [Rhodospirillales bacterium]